MKGIGKKLGIFQGIIGSGGGSLWPLGGSQAWELLSN